MKTLRFLILKPFKSQEKLLNVFIFTVPAMIFSEFFSKKYTIWPFSA